MFQAQHGDDVFEFPVLREGPPDFLCQGVMPFADDARRGHLGAGLQRVDGREKSFACPLAREHDGCRQMRECMYRRRIREIVCRHIYGLDRGDGAGVGVGNALFQPRKLRPHRGLIAQPRGHLTHQAGYLHASLDKAENIIDEQQHIAVLVIAEILGHRQRGVPHAKATARWLVHLSEDHDHVRQNTGILHIAVKLLAFAASFADSAKDAYARVVSDHVVDYFGEQHRLAHARPAEQSRLAAALQRHQDIDDFYSGFEDFRLGGTPVQWWRSPMHRTPLDIG